MNLFLGLTGKMENTKYRREIFPFEVELQSEEFHKGKNFINDIYITELGFVMVSVFNEEKKVWVNYKCGEIKDILPEKIKLKEEGDPQFSGQ